LADVHSHVLVVLVALVVGGIAVAEQRAARASSHEADHGSGAALVNLTLHGAGERGDKAEQYCADLVAAVA